MKILFSLIISLATLIYAANNFAQTSAFSGKRIKINQLKKQKPEKGSFIVQGFVVKIYICPPCPPKVYCKPCLGNNFVLSEENKSLNDYNLTDKDLIIFTSNPKKLVKGKKYQVKIKITNQKSTSEPLNNIEMISYKLIV